MAWKPDLSTIKNSELIGRRLFEPLEFEPIGSVQRAKYRLDDFLDNRLQQDLSVDRLGENQPHRPTVRFLTRLADGAAAERKKTFHGWASIRVKDLKKLSVRPSPVEAPADKANPYHAGIDRTQVRESLIAYHVAVSIKTQFEQAGGPVSPDRVAVAV